MSAGQRARNPAHLPTECFIVLVRIGEIAISEKDNHHADGQRDRHRRKNLAEPASRLRRWAGIDFKVGNWFVLHGRNQGSMNSVLSIVS